MVSIFLDDKILDRMRGVGDPVADAVIAAIMQDHDVTLINTLMRQLVRNDDLAVAELPEVVQQYFTQTVDLPTWADPVLLARGSTVFELHGPEIVLLLFCTSLPILYAVQKGAEVLLLTQRMTHHLRQRIVETAQFVLDVTAPNAFAPHGTGIRAAQKVRLIHAAVRYLVQRETTFQTTRDTECEVPINQTDLVGTMLAFSIAVLQALEKSNIRLSGEDKEAYFHLWRVVGFYLGLQPEFMPANVEEGSQFLTSWIRRYHAASEGGRRLTSALIDFMKSYVSSSSILSNLVVNWMRFCLGDTTANILGVAPYNWALVIVHLQCFVWRILNMLRYSSKPLASFNRILSRKILEGLLHYESGGTRPQFHIPDNLRSTSGLVPN